MSEWAPDGLLPADKLAALHELLFARVDEFLGWLGADLRDAGHMKLGACPVHGGDNATACQLYLEGHTQVGNWACYTRGCHQHFCPTLVGLAHGVFSRREAEQRVGAGGWQGAFPPRSMFRKAVAETCEWLGTPLLSLELPPGHIEHRRDMARHGILCPGLNREGVGLHLAPSQVLSRLDVPDPYYVSRGHPRRLLERYLVGRAKPGGKQTPLSGRVIVPVFDDEGKWIVGFSGRSLDPLCPKCKSYHSLARLCPPREEAGLFAKWRHQGFDSSACLYNYHVARQAIRKTGQAILVEGSADVWRAVEAGFHQVVAGFGLSISDEQQFLLEKAGVYRLVLLTDAGEAGDQAKKKLSKQLGDFFRVECPTLPLSVDGVMASAGPSSMTATDLADFLLSLGLTRTAS